MAVLSPVPTAVTGRLGSSPPATFPQSLCLAEGPFLDIMNPPLLHRVGGHSASSLSPHPDRDRKYSVPKGQTCCWKPPDAP